MRLAVVSTCLYSVPPRGVRWNNGWQGGYGGENQIHWLVKAFCESGITVDLYATPGSTPPMRGSLYYLPQGGWGDVFIKERETLRMYGRKLKEADCVLDWSLTKHVHAWAPHVLDDKCIMQPWGSGAPPPYRRSEKVAVWSEFQKQLFIQQGYPANIRVIPGGVDPEVFSSCFGCSKGHDYFVFLARVHPSKRPEIIVHLAKQFPNERFLIVTGTESPDHAYFLQRLQKDTEKLPNVEYHIDLGFRDKLEILRHAKASILPSCMELFGINNAEALMLGTPLINSREGAHPEIVKHGVTGFLCSTNAEYETAVKNIDLLDRTECRKNAESRFTNSLMAERYIRFVKEVIE